MASAIRLRRPRHIQNRRPDRRGALDARCQRRCRRQVDVREIAVIDPPLAIIDLKARVTIGSLLELVSTASRLALIVDVGLIFRSAVENLPNGQSRLSGSGWTGATVQFDVPPSI